jgi:hypothetical protein
LFVSAAAMFNIFEAAHRRNAVGQPRGGVHQVVLDLIRRQGGAGRGDVIAVASDVPLPRNSVSPTRALAYSMSMADAGVA